MNKLARTGRLKSSLLRVFRDSFFHADMHPGNIFVSPQSTLGSAVTLQLISASSAA